MDCGSSKIEEGLQAHCKNQPSVHGQLAGISKLNPRRLGTRYYKSEVRSDLASAERAGSAGKHCPSRARGDKNSRQHSQAPRPDFDDERLKAIAAGCAEAIDDAHFTLGRAVVNSAGGGEHDVRSWNGAAGRRRNTRRCSCGSSTRWSPTANRASASSITVLRGAGLNTVAIRLCADVSRVRPVSTPLPTTSLARVGKTRSRATLRAPRPMASRSLSVCIYFLLIRATAY
jgi:hypothetical protein